MPHKIANFNLLTRLVYFVSLLGILIGFLLLFLPESIASIVLFIIIFAFGWSIFCIQRPLPAFLFVFLIFVLAYSRLGLNLISVEGPGNRGIVALGDLLWFGLIVGLFIRHFFSKESIAIRLTFPLPVWLIFPFVGLATVLPICGVLVGDWPLSYAIPGLRQLQWASFGIFVYYLCLRYGISPVLKSTIKVIIFAGVSHLIYGLIQLGYSQGIVNRMWIYLDDLFTAYNVNSWFYYPRITGLLVNPNSYGLYGAFLLVMIISLTLVKTKVFDPRKILWWITIVAALFALIFSASRSALLGLGVAFLLFCLLMLIEHRLLLRGLIITAAGLFVGSLITISMRSLIPITLQDRFNRFLNVFSQGAVADVNALARVEEWNRLWEIYLRDFPFGTWVPTSYATGSAVDSFYIVTVMQGTPVFTLVWIIFIVSIIRLGWYAYRYAGNPLEASAGLTVLGWAAVIAGSSLTLSPMLQPHLIVPLWTFIGITIAVVHGITIRNDTNVSTYKNCPHHHRA